MDIRIEQIECSEISMISKSLEASRILAEAFNQLKSFILSYNFKDEDEEIFFFKEAKPKLCSRLIYYRKIGRAAIFYDCGPFYFTPYLAVAYKAPGHSLSFPVRPRLFGGFPL